MRKIAFLFPGQGAQHIGMGRELNDQFATARHTFEEADDILGYDFKKNCFEGSITKLSKLENMLPAILTVSVAAFRVYMQEVGIAPDFLAGHSLGEYSALTCSGALEFCDALKIVQKRSSLASEVARSCNGSMTIVDGIHVETVEEECKKVSCAGRNVAVSCFNSLTQAAISGDSDGVLEVEDRLCEKGAIITPLLTSPPFHCALMELAAVELKKEIQKYTFHEFKWPVISNIHAKPYESTGPVWENLVNQISHPVKWKDTMEYMRREGATFAIEFGPQSILSNLNKDYLKGLRTFSFTKQTDKVALMKLLRINGKVYLSNIIDQCLLIAVGSENLNKNNEEYMEGVIKPYHRIKRIREQIDKDFCEADDEQIEQAISELKLILLTKKVPVKEQLEYLEEIHRIIPEKICL